MLNEDGKEISTNKTIQYVYIIDNELYIVTYA